MLVYEYFVCQVVTCRRDSSVYRGKRDKWLLGQGATLAMSGMTFAKTYKKFFVHLSKKIHINKVNMRLIFRPLIFISVSLARCGSVRFFSPC